MKERAASTSPKELGLQIKDELGAFMADFDGEKIKKIDTWYSQLQLMANFVSFDFLFLLKKFDSGIPERTFNYTPKYETIRNNFV